MGAHIKPGTQLVTPQQAARGTVARGKREGGKRGRREERGEGGREGWRGRREQSPINIQTGTRLEAGASYVAKVKP